MPSTRRTFALQAAACCAVLGLAPPGPLGAQGAYPSRTITMIVPYTAGGGVDTLARFLDEAATTEMCTPSLHDALPG